MARSTVLTDLARLGFADLSASAALLAAAEGGLPFPVEAFSHAADPDLALRSVIAMHGRAPDTLREFVEDEGACRRLLRVLGASEGLGEFFARHPGELAHLASAVDRLPEPEELVADLLDAVEADDEGFTRLEPEAATVALRVRYRRHLARIAAFDTGQPDPLAAVDAVAAALADLAGAALDASLAVARSSVRFPRADVAQTRLAIIGMGKAGARELNYVSDVDVIHVVEGSGELSSQRAVDIGTRLAMQVARGINDLAIEPGLWEVDANLRPEGKDGALVRTLESHLAYYDRWANSWEFQALLKARPLAGDRELGERYVAGVAPKVWASSGRENFVESVQRMRERVTEHIPADQVDQQIKLGPGGLRDVEFTVQLLQLVHGATDPEVRQRSTLEALAALAGRGYIGRSESAEFAREYRFLRLLEHRLQLARLRRTHLMPTDDEHLRVLARSTRLEPNGRALVERWQRSKHTVRSLHERLFYRPLLSAVAALPEEGVTLTSEQAIARLAAIGFVDPRGALGHVAALSGGVSRRAAIQRTLLPVLLQWFAETADPDHGLLAFRRLSERLGQSHWFLRMLRDSSGAAGRLTRVLGSSKYAGDLLERHPESAAWLEDERDLHPRPLEALVAETTATIARHRGEPEAAASALRSARRREVLRLSLNGILGVDSIETIARGLSDVTTALLRGLVALAHDPADGFEFAVIAMGRYGGEELGFGSDADVLWVQRPTTLEPHDAQTRATKVVARINALAEDNRLPLELDAGLRPEGKNGPLVRSLDSYRAYYSRWSLTWEAQALLRARGVAGDEALLRDFTALADEVRYPETLDDREVREVKRIKARVESERLPQGADPTRHLKLGRGSLSDVEWFVQLLQLQHAATIPALRTPSTLAALTAAVDAGLVDPNDAARLSRAWILASRTRSAVTLWSAKTSDVLPSDRRQLEGVARLLGYPPHSASALEDDYLRTTRLARQVFERQFYGVQRGPAPTA
ncbi:bifunctional [glutamine synthetase] adenylyltransferase/[glutamine synthetase]-adenylyl-L-tyrosine phosphorylase [Desertivibrio insolitus]|uniref:bifunctional [glutamine synthetase] adenylyltransferase/[glutamine synthetase]-adenylyl-L-tyrosine phosphorylase n=1 Tax=Herbiconiux sp. SYSU D00978 TaxID=2812562 RepID=UPI001A96DC7E|nr:bifunctional [glutamine synthetase] adenylyltransferase/[glutamine synthetase]-adenylyl-L-tyrosine phosphorylase [Herbiconiux sp. SYSU D00978]